tara:strand:+ start:2510 stop:2845 length:336 start_codon:yes stop_codon:yes gene_type:complete
MQTQKDPGAFNNNAIAKYIKMQLRVLPSKQSGPDYLKRLMSNQVPQLDMKPGAKFKDLYSKNNTLDNKFSNNYAVPNKPMYKLRPIEKHYKSPNIASTYNSSLEDTAIGYQ